MNPRDGEIRNLKLDLDGHTAVLLALLDLDGREAKRRAHLKLLTSRELLDGPDHGVGIGHVADSASVGFEDR